MLIRMPQSGVLCLIFFLIVISACTKELTTQEMQDKLIQANSNLNSYSMNMKLSIRMGLDIGNQKTEIASESSVMGGVDVINKRMSLKGIAKSEALGAKTEFEIETYILDDIIYSKSINIWTKQKLQEELWVQNDYLQQSLELIKSGPIEQLPDETIKGNSYYAIKLTPDKKKIVEFILKQQNQDESLNKDIDFNDMVKGVSYIIWINKKTFVIERIKALISMEMTGKNLGVTDAKEPAKVAMGFEMDTSISEINKPVDVVLPPEARNAMDLDELRDTLPEKFQETKERSSVTGAAIADAFA